MPGKAFCLVLAFMSQPFFSAQTRAMRTVSSALSLSGRILHHCSAFTRQPHPKAAFHLSAAKDSGANKGSSSLESRTTHTLPPVPTVNGTSAHRIVFLRHGESEFNNANVFTGWCDVALTRRGVVESIEAGQVFASHGLIFRKCYTSLLTRSIVTAHRCLEAAGISYTPLVYDFRMNERHYGALQGLSKERTAERLGRDLVMRWRRSYDARPPAMLPNHPHYNMIQNDARYRHLTDIPLAESLQDCQVRAIKAWEDIVNDIRDTAASSTDDTQQSHYTLVVAHANTLRALVMHLDDIGAEEIEGLNIPTAIPFYYDIDAKTGQVISDHDDNSNDTTSKSGRTDRIGLGKFRGVYIADERKRRSFLERRRAASDPWLWALHDHQVARSMLLEDASDSDLGSDAVSEQLEELGKEADENTKLFSPDLYGISTAHDEL